MTSGEKHFQKEISTVLSNATTICLIYFFTFVLTLTASASETKEPPNDERAQPESGEFIASRTLDNSVEGDIVFSHKERRRTAYMNAAFDALRRCLPDIPPDTKVTNKEQIFLQIHNTIFVSLLFFGRLHAHQ